MTIGFFLLILSFVSMSVILENGRIEFIVLISICAWIIAVFFTDKYVHKYPQRYLSYLLASHAKAAVIMALILLSMGWIVGQNVAPLDTLWTGFILFIVLDFLISALCRKEIPTQQSSETISAVNKKDQEQKILTDGECQKIAASLIHKKNMLGKVQPDLDKSFFDFLSNNLPDFQEGSGDVLILDDINASANPSGPSATGLLIGRIRINDVLRLNQYLQFCTLRIGLGGYFVVRYVPLENAINKLRKRYKGFLYGLVFLLHFIWYRAIPKIPWLEKLYFTPLLSWLDAMHLSVVKKRNRALARAEVWGRLSFLGMKVIAESKGDDELFIIAQKVAQPVHNKIPSFFMIAALEKVGLDGQIIRTHKIRTMFPFSEFLQQRIFEDHGLAATGKFANDFRLTEYGRFLRKYWLDELPQIFDWLRGEIKLVGMRATSPQFLGLYPKELYDLYIQIKPGLIPPIFGENTAGFDQIVDVELQYLQSYRQRPFRTDIRYFVRTFTDIVFKGIRSK